MMHLKLDHRTIAMRGAAKLPGSVGQFKDRDCLIEVLVGQSAQQQADTLLHEIMHAVWATRAFPPTMTEEDCCTRMASGLATVIRDNPLLIREIILALTENMPLFEQAD